MDRTLIEDLIAANKPFRVETAAGRTFEVPHRDFVSFTRNRTALQYRDWETDRKSTRLNSSH